MNYKLIVLPNPVLVSDEKPLIDDYDYSVNYATVTKVDKERAEIQNLPSYKGMYKKVIAGIEGLPKLDLSAIAEEIGWVDVEKLSIDLGLKYYIGGNYDFENGVRKGILEYQSLNEKKYSEEDMIDFHNFVFNHPNQFLKMGEYLEEFKKSRKPKEYNVEVEMEDMLQKRHGNQWYDLPNQKEGRETDGIYQTVKRVKITNNTIKVTKILR